MTIMLMMTKLLSKTIHGVILICFLFDITMRSPDKISQVSESFPGSFLNLATNQQS